MIVTAGARLGRIPLLPIAFIHFYMAMGMPVFSVPRLTSPYGRIRISSAALEKASLACLLFAVLALVSSFLFRRVFAGGFQRLAPSFEPRSSASIRGLWIRRLLAGMSICLHLLIAYSHIGQSFLGSLGFAGFLFSSPALSLGALRFDVIVSKNRANAAAFWLATIVLALAGLGTGMLSNAAFPCIVAAVLLWTTESHTPWAFVAAVVVAFLGLNGAKGLYRALTWGRPTSVEERARNWSEALSTTYSRGAKEGFSDSTDTTVSRLAHLAVVAQMFDWVPSRIAHAGPDQWLMIPLEYVPRVIWPDKPEHAREFNNRYSTLFRLQTKASTRTTTITLPSVGDGYWRLGWLGVVIEALALGMLLGFHRSAADTGSYPLAMFAISFTVHLTPEQHVLAAVAGQLQVMVVFALVLVLAFRLPDLISSDEHPAGKLRKPQRAFR